VDALRLDAVHAILDASPRTFLEELELAVEERFPERLVHLIPESAANDARLVRRREVGGHGLDAVWNDDFHHALHTLLTGERRGYYCDYGALSQLEDAYRDGFVYSGEYSRFRRRRHGISSRDVPAERFVVFAQNHDQVGNRLVGDRLSASVSLEKLKLAASAVILSPFLPLLFMGEEYGETAPFPYFVSHTDPDLVEAVRRGRREEFAGFEWEGEPPDPQSEDTFRSARLRRELQRTDRGATLRALYRQLLKLRRELAPLARRSKDRMKVVCHERQRVLELSYWSREGAPSQIAVLLHLGDDPVQVDVGLLRGLWRKRLDTAAAEWGGPGATTLERVPVDEATVLSLAPWSAVVLEWDAAAEEAPRP
jgi:maltooligosyltrehalose trehalohydrolase